MRYILSRRISYPDKQLRNPHPETRTLKPRNPRRAPRSAYRAPRDAQHRPRTPYPATQSYMQGADESQGKGGLWIGRVFILLKKI